MNNMMSNNSQLHNMLQGHQSPPLTMESLPSDASPSPSSSLSSHSQSCSNPSSPQCPQDSESVVSMDTNSSSASSCSSDSGEDESVVTMSRQHQDAFAYSHQRSQCPDQASPSPATVESGCDSRMEDQQERWNCWNNDVVTRGYQNSSYSGVYHQQPQQQLNSTPSCEPAEDSQRPHEFNTQTTSSGYSGPSNSVNSRAHLVRVQNFMNLLLFIICKGAAL